MRDMFNTGSCPRLPTSDQHIMLSLHKHQSFQHRLANADSRYLCTKPFLDKPVLKKTDNTLPFSTSIPPPLSHPPPAAELRTTFSYYSIGSVDPPMKRDSRDETQLTVIPSDSGVVDSF